jgi:predicted ester cyclase
MATSSPASSGVHSSQEAITALALRFYEPLQTGDTTLVQEFIAPDWLDIPLGKGQTPGRPGYGQMVSSLRTFLPNLSWQIADVITMGDRVVVRSLVSGTPRIKLLGLPFRGKPLQFMTIDIHQVREGKIQTTWHLEDRLSILGQFGLPRLQLGKQ